MKIWKTHVGYALAIKSYRIFFRNYSSGIGFDRYDDLIDLNVFFLTLRKKFKS